MHTNIKEDFAGNMTFKHENEGGVPIFSLKPYKSR